MSYTTRDFHQTLFHRQIAIDPASVVTVISAWGHQGGWGEWEGGFLLKTKDGRYAYIEGWCDTTGWGCQDGAAIMWFDREPSRSELVTSLQEALGTKEDADWDEAPIDLNRSIDGGYKDAD